VNATSQSLVPIKIGTGSDWVDVVTSKTRESVGASFSLGIRNTNSDYELWSWGANGAGQLGDGNSPTNNGIPTLIGHDTEYAGDGGGWDVITVGWFSSAGIYSTKTEMSGSVLRSSGFSGIESAIDNPDKPTNFGWGFATGDPYLLGYTSSVAVEMVNECGDLFNFRTGETGSAFNLAVVGEHSWAIIGNSGSSGQIGYGGASSDCSLIRP
jgi:alpha-tubulin suppressor-like RCC1 family protein